jgi:hypothetical protein
LCLSLFSKKFEIAIYSDDKNRDDHNESIHNFLFLIHPHYLLHDSHLLIQSRIHDPSSFCQSVFDEFRILEEFYTSLTIWTEIFTEYNEEFCFGMSVAESDIF